VPAVPDGPTPSGPLTSDQASRAALRATVVPTVVVGLLAIVVSTVVAGGLGALGATLGFVITIVFFAVGQYLVDKVLRTSPETALATALLVYVTQILVLFVLIALLRDATWLNARAFAATILACTLTWLGASVLAYSRMKVLYVEPVADPAAEGEPQPEYDQ
jgi:ATP synthase protein I